MDNDYLLDSLDALCLGVSDLLKTPSVMAKDLSPAQLDAVESVLVRQLDAVRQARAIHGRLRAESLEKED
jgi:hypothetical protein